MKTIIDKNEKGYGYKYTDIAHIHEYLEANNMSYYQYVDSTETGDYIVTVPIVNGEEKMPRRGCKIVTATLSGINNPAQQQGSALTYARRYSLLMAFGLATDDDDAACLSTKKEITKEDAEQYVLTFGKYSGMALKQVVASDSKYTKWLLDSENTNQEVKTMITLLTGEVQLSEEEQKEKLTLMNELMKVVEEKDKDYEQILKHYKVKSNTELTIDQLKEAIEICNK